MSKNFVEMRFRNGEVSGRVRLHRMIDEGELPTILHGALHGLELGRAAAAGVWARGGAPDVDEELREATTARYDAPASSALWEARAAAGDLWEARAEAEWLTPFWCTTLRGIGPLTFKAPTALRFALGSDSLNVFLHGTYARLSINNGINLPIPGTHYEVSVERANVQEIRAFVLWLIRSSGIPVAAPPGWPDPPASEEPPNGAGERYVPGVGAEVTEADVDMDPCAALHENNPAPPRQERTPAEALIFWCTTLSGISPVCAKYQVRESLCFQIGTCWLDVEPAVGGLDAVICCGNDDVPDQMSSDYWLDASRSTDEIRAFVLWFLRAHDIAVETPVGWPEVSGVGAPPNDAGRPVKYDVEGPDADGFEEV